MTTDNGSIHRNSMPNAPFPGQGLVVGLRDVANQPHRDTRPQISSPHHAITLRVTSLSTTLQHDHAARGGWICRGSEWTLP
jgi:hypothetical protein